MSSFTSELVVIPMPDGRSWKLVKSFTYHVGSKFSRTYLKVPAGFITDFASIPWLFWTFLPSWGKYGKAAVVHDYLYQTQTKTRKESDQIFLEAMGVLGVRRWRKYPMYLAVRWFGWLVWKRKI